MEQGTKSNVQQQKDIECNKDKISGEVGVIYLKINIIIWLYIAWVKLGTGTVVIIVPNPIRWKLIH